MRLALALIFALISSYIGAKWVAQYKLEARFSELSQAAKGMCTERGAQTPSIERMREKLEQMAAAHGVQLSELEVTIMRLDDARATGPDAQVQAGIAAIPGMQITGRQAVARAHVRATQWLWHLDQELSTRCTLERKIERVIPSNFGAEPQ